jgi:hypothetical protein
MKLMIVVEGNSDVAILRALLSTEVLSASDMFLAEARSTLVSVARTLLVKHGRPLAVLIDTESLEPSAIAETVTTTDQLLGAVAGGTPFRAIYCIPELEVVFFEAPIGLKRIFPHYDQHFFPMFAKTRPKEALQYLFKNGGGPTNLSQFLDDLTSEDVEHLRTTDPIKQLINFADELGRRLSKAGA